ncbi:MAG: DUF6519 domain-containing protein [Gammaproteobacteria bacterium]
MTLKGIPSSDAGQHADKHPYLRRWDQQNGDQGGIPIKESSAGEEEWIDLEEGIQVLFPKSSTESGEYRSGDYWLIPARQITGDVEWPNEDEQPKALLPHGVIHYYAPLAIIASSRQSTTAGTAAAKGLVDLRRILAKSWI